MLKKVGANIAFRGRLSDMQNEISTELTQQKNELKDLKKQPDIRSTQSEIDYAIKYRQPIKDKNYEMSILKNKINGAKDELKEVESVKMSVAKLGMTEDAFETGVKDLYNKTAKNNIGFPSFEKADWFYVGETFKSFLETMQKLAKAGVKFSM